MCAHAWACICVYVCVVYVRVFVCETEEEVGGRHWGGGQASGEQGKMEKTGCKIICGTPTTLAVKGLMMMMMCTCVCVRARACVCVGINVANILVGVTSAYMCSIPIDNGWPFIFYIHGTDN